MHPIRPSHAQQGTQATREPPSSAAQSIPTTHFKPHFVVGGGDCLFHALCMGSTNQPAVPVSMEHIMSLRQDAANYVAEHRAALISHPSFGGEAGVNALYGLLITQGQWNENAGDLVPPILARVLGREIRILEPTHHGDSYNANENRIFRPQDTDTGLPPAKPDTEQPPMYLAHINNAHYEYLEPRAPHADTAPESIKARSLSDSIASLSDASSFDSTSITRWIDKLLDEQSNGLTDEDISLPPPPQDSSFGRVSSLSSLESYSSKGFLESFTAKEKNSPTEGVDQPPRKRPRHAELRPEQKNERVEHHPELFLGKRSVITQGARNQIKKAFTEAANNRSFDALTQEEQDTEMMRISRATGYSPFGILTTLTGGGNKRVRTHAARNEIISTFTETANNRSFETLTKEEQMAQVVRISRETGYNPSGVQTTLTGGGNMQVATQIAKTEITKAYIKAASNTPFSALTKKEQAAEVTRISRETGYNPSGVQSTLSSRDNGPATAKIIQREQADKVTRILQETEHRAFGALTTLTDGDNKRVRTHTARNEIMNAFTEAAHNRSFNALTTEEQAAEATRISRKTGYRSFGVYTTLTGRGNKPVRTQIARKEIKKAFADAAHNRSFNALTAEEQAAEVIRISRKTGYRSSGVHTTLTGGSNTLVRTQIARKEIKEAFTNATHNRSFNALTTEEQDAEVTRISRETGYKEFGVRSTLTNSEANEPVITQTTRNEITSAFTDANSHPFEALTKEDQDAEVTCISRETGHHPSTVRTTLTGGGTKQALAQIDKIQITKAFTEANNRPFEALTKKEQASEVLRISRKTRYNLSEVLMTLNHKK